MKRKTTINYYFYKFLHSTAMVKFKKVVKRISLQ